MNSISLHNEQFAAITCYFNPCGYRTRELGYQRFVDGLRRQQVSLWTIEATLPGVPNFVAPGPQVVHVELPEHDWLWQKERLLNLLIHRLPQSVTKVAWLDCDLLFENDEWPKMASQALDTWPVIQPFNFVHWLGPNDERPHFEGITDRRAGVAYVAMHYPQRATDFRICAPGIAWAARRELLNQHGIYERAIIGSGDTLTTLGFYGWFKHGHLNFCSASAKHDALQYIYKLHRDVRGYVGYLPTAVAHIWHGSHQNRLYQQRHQLLRELDFDPQRHLAYDPVTGLLRWTPETPSAIKTHVQQYFRLRKEDG